MGRGGIGISTVPGPGKGADTPRLIPCRVLCSGGARCFSAMSGARHPLYFKVFYNAKQITTGFAIDLGVFIGSSHYTVVARQTRLDDPPPSLHPHYRASSLLRGGPSLGSASVLCLSRFLPLEGLPLAVRDGGSIEAQVPTFRIDA